MFTVRLLVLLVVSLLLTGTVFSSSSSSSIHHHDDDHDDDDDDDKNGKDNDTDAIVVSVPVSLDASAIQSTTGDNFICVTLDWWPGLRDDIWTNKSLWAIDLDSTLLRSALSALSPVYLRLGGSLQDQIVYTIQEEDEYDDDEDDKKEEKDENHAKNQATSFQERRGLLRHENYQDDSKDVSSSSSLTWPDWSRCLPFRSSNRTKVKLEGGCFHLRRLQELSTLCVDTGCQLVFGLGYFYGRNLANQVEWTGPWDPSNAELLMQYVIQKNLTSTLAGFELGNEVDGKSGKLAGFNASEFAADLVILKKLIVQYFSSNSALKLTDTPRPFLLGIDTARYNTTYTRELLTQMPFDTLDGYTYHIYSLGSGAQPVSTVTEKVLSPNHLDEYKHLAATVHKDITSIIPSTRATQIWLGEGGGAYGSGCAGVTDSFVSAFWYLDQLGQAAWNGHQTVCRQALVGGRYALLQNAHGPVNPDFYAALLWRKLMGKQVLTVNVPTSDFPFVRGYAHCSSYQDNHHHNTNNDNNDDGKSTVVLLNLDRQKTVKIDLTILGIDEQNSRTSSLPCSRSHRLEYHMSATLGDLHGKSISLNGKLLYPLNNGTTIPTLDPKVVPACHDLILQPLTYVFVVLPQSIPLCRQRQ